MTGGLHDDPQPADDQTNDFGGLEAIRLRLMQEHGQTVDAGDPVLMLFTLHEAFLADYERLLARRNGEAAAGIEAAGRKFTQEVRQAIDAFREDALTEGLASQVRQVSALTERTAAVGRRSNRFNLFFTAINVTAAVVAVTALVILGN